MKPDEIRLNDWLRILFGEVPPSFFIEVIIRTVFIFLLLIISMRLLGRRMSAQINRIEMVALFTLAAAIGVPLQAPDRGLLPAFVIAVLVVLVGRLVVTLAFKHKSFESKVEDDVDILISNGVLNLQKVLRTRLNVKGIFAELRSEGVRHLGEVKRFYFEASGSFTLVKEENPACGLSVLPPDDHDFINEQTQCDEQVCGNCGQKKKNSGEAQHCSNCNENKWTNAIC